MSCLRPCFRDRGPRAETEAMKRQNSGQEREIIELQEDNVEESEADHDKPLSAQTRKEKDHWKTCRNIVFWKCKLWMVITTIFLVFFLVILISLILYSNVYTDEDDYWDPDELLSSGNFRNFSGTLELICGLPHLFSEDITKRLTDVYSSSPALGRYFRSAQVVYFSNESSTVSYQLEFSVPASAEGFMENTMNPDFVRDVLRQNIYDEDDTFNPETSECNRLKLDPASLTLTCKCCTLERIFFTKSRSIYLQGEKSFWKGVGIC
ncbi:PREDICTED: LOW QUALITY PROTEIN: TPA-induced transmembrane protein [Phaethon lepturus]|uniref:LOW QUALITY PROTEIN: TPA-induced transmembrane protein n=1 Tax=Phaethon lepturus TaxID=97097 RepID=UPI0005305EAC|nr:PREDICTED: LOW QUALITY PROTEIN: TPA-induced transmembrane protein [Phaethon lepturus]